jgi:glycosyltransferase involved in cell wall biosynthesis
MAEARDPAATIGKPPTEKRSRAGMRAVTAVIAEGLFSYQIGGSERVGVDLALEFARRGYKVVCFAFYDSDGPMRAELEKAGIRCLDMNYERFNGISRRVSYQWHFWRMLRAERISALHVHHATALILAGIPARLAQVARVVMTEHGLHQLQERPSYRRSAARYCRYATDITVVEPAQATYFNSELHVPQSKLHYVPNGVRIVPRSAERIARMRSNLGVPDGTFNFLYVGRLSPVKDLGTLLRAFSELPPDVLSRSRLTLVGDGSERLALDAKRETLGLRDRVEFLGARTDVAEVLMAADAFVMSSTTEGLPMALLEAMAAEVPCAATAVGGIPELLANGRGLTVPPRDHRKLADAMSQLARSPELRERITASAMEEVRLRYVLDTVVDQYLSFLGLPARAR